MALITSWTDGGMDWDDPDPTDSRYIEAIIRATNERCTAAGVTLLSLTVVDGNRYCNASMLTAIETKVFGLIPSFVNHTDNDGDWSGELIVPNWTVESMLEYLAEPRYKIAAYKGCHTHHPDVIAWMKLQYSILNQLRWVGGRGINEEKTSVPQPTDIDGSKTWADMLTEYFSADFSWHYNYHGQQKYMYQGNNTTGHKYIYLDLWRYTVDYSANTEMPAFTWDFYYIPYFDSPDSYIYLWAVNGETANVLNKTSSTSTGGMIAQVVLPGDEAAIRAAFIEPFNVGWTGWEYTYVKADIYFVLKFDVEGGFMFRV